jgi:NhaA family Na+:H+ antiporter
MKTQKLPSLFGAVVRPLQAFFHLEAASGILLFVAAVAALAWANSPEAPAYFAALSTPIALGIGSVSVTFSLLQVVNDGLMTLFFFVVGMEIKRELALGELRTPARAALPAVAAFGGMLVPAAIYLAFNHSGAGRAGWGIPMATDIAFSIGCLMLLKSRVPYALIVFLTALAIFDDVGGILVIALFYGHGLHLAWLGAALACCAVLLVMNRADIGNGAAYAVVGVALWYSLHHGGIHATIAGVILGLAIPASAPRSATDVLDDLSRYLRSLKEKSGTESDLAASELLMIEDKLEDVAAPLDRFVHGLHPFVAFGIMPLFALVNSGVSVAGMGLGAITGPVALGAGLGLLVGKMTGIFALTWLTVRFQWAPMPGGASPAKLLGISTVAGIGFTVALFIAALAFPSDSALLDQAKLGILVGSFLSGVLGSAILLATPRLKT